MGRSFFLALQLLTRIPVPGGRVPSAAEAARAPAAYPLVGLIVGAVAVAAHRLAAAAGWSPPVVGVWTALAWVFITGNLHLDGLMDTADALGSGQDREGMLAIMRDSRVGSFGVMAGIGAFALKAALIGELSPEEAGALPASAALGRWAIVYGAARFRYPRAEGMGKGIIGHVGQGTLLIASAGAVGAAFILLPLSVGLAAVAVAGLAAWAGARFLAAKLGGLTGDTLGALCEGTEIAVLAVCTAVL